MTTEDVQPKPDDTEDVAAAPETEEVVQQDEEDEDFPTVAEFLQYGKDRGIEAVDAAKTGANRLRRLYGKGLSQGWKSLMAGISGSPPPGDEK